MSVFLCVDCKSEIGFWGTALEIRFFPIYQRKIIKYDNEGPRGFGVLVGEGYNYIYILITVYITE